MQSWKKNQEYPIVAIFDGLIFQNLGTVKIVEDPVLEDAGNVKFQYPFETTISLSVSINLYPCELPLNLLLNVNLP